jgi:tryptophan synthase beta chain
MYLLSDEYGQVTPAHSVSAGLDYPGVGPEHAYYADEGLATYVSVGDDDALRAFRVLAETEGIIPALETSHALATAMDLAPELGPGAEIVVGLSGRGDKDVNEAMRVLEAVRGEAPS